MKPSVLFILHLPPPVHGAAMVGKYIHDSELINSEFDCQYINLSTASGLEDIGKFKIKKLFSFWYLIKRIRQTVIELKPAFVYITPNAKGGPFYKDYIVVMMLKMMGCRVVAHFHNKGVSSRQDRFIDDFLYRRFFKNIKVILLSERLYPDIQKYVKREDVYICPNGIPERSGKIKVGSEKSSVIPHILFLSNLIIEKGVLVLMDALKILKDKGCSFVCDFVGAETVEIDTNRFNEEVKTRSLDDVVIYHGKRYGTEKDDFLRNADVFVFPTYYNNECFPLVLLEAMQYGLPIITTNEGGIADIVKDGENGLICKARNPEDLANALMRLLDDPLLRIRMGQNGYQKYKERYTLDVFEKRFVEILKSVG